MKIPKVGKGKFVLLTADLNTGTILNNDFSIYIKGEDYFIVKDEKEESRRFAKRRVLEKNDIEVILYDGDGNFLEIFRN